jgi:hypothetical protein
MVATVICADQTLWWSSNNTPSVLDAPPMLWAEFISDAAGNGGEISAAAVDIKVAFAG